MRYFYSALLIALYAVAAHQPLSFVIISVAFYGMLDLDFPVYADWGTPSSVIAGGDGGGGGQGRSNRGARRGGRGGDGGRNKRKRDDDVDDSNADRPSNQQSTFHKSK